MRRAVALWVGDLAISPGSIRRQIHDRLRSAVAQLARCGRAAISLIAVALQL